jgi:hypothetical protein
MSAPFQKIVVQNPVVELDGDEMTRIIWKKIREEVCILTVSAVYRFLLVYSSFFLTFNSISNTTIWDWNTEIRYAFANCSPISSLNVHSIQ